MAVEWAEYKIRVNTLSPGYIRTAMTNLLLEGKPDLLQRWENDNPMKRIAAPSEFKGPAIYLLSKASSFVTGSDLRVDGGVSVICYWNLGLMALNLLTLLSFFPCSTVLGEFYL